jgi:hypothetical protein
MDLTPGVFKRRDPHSIAASIKSSAEHSRRRKSAPFRSAMSMLTFYINRAGKGLDAAQRQRLQAAKQELRALFHRDGSGRHGATSRPAAGPRGATGGRHSGPRRGVSRRAPRKPQGRAASDAR